ncbi:Pancreatic lipase-related protein 2 [Orchesella cincta]|uniref:Pancreatic lipase-related protein 2 n=1 Tax=Orchesella cincta TaxID=48709 RepID=A0A1D2M9Z2_ORCCI|nr:Pancreatic lipase-related protein 2 [Orchesella cincta]
MQGKFLLLLFLISTPTTADIDINVSFPEPETNEEEFGMPKIYHQINDYVSQLNISRNPDDVRFFLYNKLDPNISHELFLNDQQSFQNSPFDPNQKTVLLIHGFWTNGSSPMPTNLRKAFMESGSRSNIIIVNWGLLSTPVPRVLQHKPFSYPIVVPRKNPHHRTLTGCSYCGSVGRTLSAFPENGGRKVARITGLDPARRYFTDSAAQKLTSDAANFVDIYYTAAGSMGIPTLTDGHVNFIPNGGHHQPGCLDPTNPFFGGEAEFGGCSHDVVHRIYAASITRNITACECEPELAKIMKCPVNCTDSILAGERCPTSARGLYYFETDKNYYTE